MTEQESYESEAVDDLELENAALYSVNSYLEKRLQEAESRMGGEPFRTDGFVKGFFAGLTTAFFVSAIVILFV